MVTSLSGFSVRLYCMLNLNWHIELRMKVLRGRVIVLQIPMAMFKTTARAPFACLKPHKDSTHSPNNRQSPNQSRGFKNGLWLKNTFQYVCSAAT